MLALLAKGCDQTLSELYERLVARGIATSKSALSWFFLRHEIVRREELGMRLSKTVRIS